MSYTVRDPRKIKEFEEEEAIRIYDYIGRFGGKEFLIVIPGAKEYEAYSIGERVRSAIGETAFFVDGSKIRVTTGCCYRGWKR